MGVVGWGGVEGVVLPCADSVGWAWVRYHIPGAPDPKSAPSRLSGTCLCLLTTDPPAPFHLPPPTLTIRPDITASSSSQ